MNEKRVRSQNFSNDEKSTLLNIISIYKEIVENKKTDAVTTKEKNDVWERIANNFNAACPDEQYRDVGVLKKFYENKKKEVRKLAAEEKFKTNSTGGGPPPVLKKDVCFDLVLSIINQKTVYGLPNKFSNLADPPSNKGVLATETGVLSTDTNENVYELKNDASAEENVSLDFLEESRKEHPTDMEVIDINDADVFTETTTESKEPDSRNKESIHTWKKYTPTILKEAKSAALKRKLSPPSSSYEKVAEKQNVRNFPKKRSAVVVKALSSSNLQDKYDQLVEKRLKIASMQERQLLLHQQYHNDKAANQNAEHLKRMEIMNAEHSEHLKKMELMENEHAEHLKRMEIMNVELLLKMKQLNSYSK